MVTIAGTAITFGDPEHKFENHEASSLAKCNGQSGEAKADHKDLRTKNCGAKPKRSQYPVAGGLDSHKLKEGQRDDEDKIDIPKVVHSTSSTRKFEARQQSSMARAIEIKEDNDIIIEKLLNPKSSGKTCHEDRLTTGHLGY